MDIAPQIVEQASEWFITMRDPEADPEQAAQFVDWLRASPTHVQAYLDIAKLWGDSAHIDREFDVSAAAAQPENVVPLRNARAPMPVQAPARGPVRSRKWQALAASFVGAGVLASALWWQDIQPPVFSTIAGEQRIVTLDDGSIVHLNSKSRFTVRMTDNVRRIDLIEGQALFDVAKDSARPFVVHSGNAAVRAVGTRFDVYRKNSGTLVSVVEGRVAVNGADALPARDPGSAVLLGAGEQITVTRTGGFNRPEKPNVATATSWLEQKLVFDGQPLGEVLTEFNRYTRTPIVLSDPSLAALRVNAVFLTTSPESLLKFIDRFEGVNIERGADEVRISRAK